MYNNTFIFQNETNESIKSQIDKKSSHSPAVNTTTSDIYNVMQTSYLTPDFGMTPDICYSSGSAMSGVNPDLIMTPLQEVTTPIPLFLYEATPPFSDNRQVSKQVIIDELVRQRARH